MEKPSSPGTDRVHKVSISPRGIDSCGATRKWCWPTSRCTRAPRGQRLHRPPRRSSGSPLGRIDRDPTSHVACLRLRRTNETCVWLYLGSRATRNVPYVNPKYSFTSSARFLLIGTRVLSLVSSTTRY